MLKIGPLQGVVPVARELGADPDALLIELGQDPLSFRNPEAEIPYVDAVRLLGRAARLLDCDHFGLLVGMRADPVALGLTGLLMQTAPDVGTALADLGQHFELHDTGGLLVVAHEGRIASLGYVVREPGLTDLDAAYDVAIAIGCRLLRALCGDEWNPAEVRLSRPPPGTESAYRRFYRTRITFSAEQNSIEFDRHWMGRRPPKSDPALYGYLKREAISKGQRSSGDIVEDTRRLTRAALAAGRATAAGVSSRLEVSERTLERRLRVHGTNFRTILDDVRFEVAKHLLAESRLPLWRIAEVVGYGDPSAFNRAFLRWSGTTPGRYRK